MHNFKLNRHCIPVKKGTNSRIGLVSWFCGQVQSPKDVIQKIEKKRPIIPTSQHNRKPTMVSTSPRKTQDWGVTKYSVFDGILSTKALTFIVYVCLPEWNARKVSTGSIIYINYPRQRRTLHCTFGDGFSIESTKACKKIKNKKSIVASYNTAIIKSVTQLLALKQFSLLGDLKLQIMYKNGVSYTS